MLDLLQRADLFADAHIVQILATDDDVVGTAGAVGGGEDEVGSYEGSAAEVAEAVLEGDGVGVAVGWGLGAADDAGGYERGGWLLTRG
mmetsp:Transcript_11011/g.23114  ORF Transcript_11011/g.23114 Transcript_11011/m.23114 type:complete len:88 (+) Transcript_11011:1507-1770(+)